MGPEACTWRGCSGLLSQYAAARATLLAMLQRRLFDLGLEDDLDDDLEVALRELGVQVRSESDEVVHRRSLRTILGEEGAR